MKKIILSIVCAAFIGVLAAATASAQQNAATTSANASANIVTAISISKTADLDFGDIVTGGTTGTVVLTAGASPSRTSTGGTTLANSVTVGDAVFTVSGQAASTYAITLPSSPVTLTSGGNTMTVDTFTSSPTPTGTLSGGGTETLYVGATLNVGANQASGTYTGNFSVTVTYN